jgi:hypothetical protein
MFASLLCLIALGFDPEKPGKTLPPPRQDVAEFKSGVYEVRGFEVKEDEKLPYEGFAIFKKVAKDRYIIQWTTEIGANVVGFGYVRDGYLICAWRTGDIIGQTEYRIGNAGVHEGRFIHSRTSTWQTETVRFRMGLLESSK